MKVGILSHICTSILIGQSSEWIPLHTWVIDDSECLSRTILSVSDVSGEYFLVNLSTKSSLSRDIFYPIKR